MAEISIHINGAGNAWPIPLGKVHPFYQYGGRNELANASVSIIKRNDNRIFSEFLMDAGHGIIQHLINTRNRIPEAMAITHPHFDHTASIDWIAQSFYKKWDKEKPYPVYCTSACFEGILKTYPHLSGIIHNRELLPATEVVIDEFPGLSITAFPVYHGASAPGASAFLISFSGVDQLLFTGDVLYPLFRNTDYDRFKRIPFLITDGNNRYPYPGSNHWSVQPFDPDGKTPERLTTFRNSLSVNGMITSQAPGHDTDPYYADLRNDLNTKPQMLSIVDVVSLIQPKQTLLIHYSGDEDQRYYDERILDPLEFSQWLQQISDLHCSGCAMKAALPGEKYLLAK